MMMLSLSTMRAAACRPSGSLAAGCVCARARLSSPHCRAASQPRRFESSSSAKADDSAPASPHDPKTGSSYNNYHTTSQVYDKFRTPVGLGIIRDTIAAYSKAHGFPPSMMNLLDAGCGSGNYLAELQGDVGTAVGLEFNAGMREQAIAKGLTVTKGSITDMPFDENSFDMVVTNQVLQHLEARGRERTKGFPNTMLAFREVSRILKPGGYWLLNTSTPEQQQVGMWWYHLIPRAAHVLSKHYPPLDELHSMLSAAGFESYEQVLPGESLVPMDRYYNLEAAFDEEFRNAESTWSMATEDEIEQGLAKLRRIIDDGKAEQFIEEMEAVRKQVDQTVTIVAKMPE